MTFFLPGEIFWPISPPALIGELLSHEFCVNDNIEDMATFTALTKTNISVMHHA
jgi:hypothetical protein